jgi:hypothetical protein
MIIESVILFSLLILLGIGTHMTHMRSLKRSRLKINADE